MSVDRARSLAPELLVELDEHAGPLHAQVEEQLRTAIRDGRLTQGTPLPSSRLLADDLGVSRGVVSEAYGQLAAEGWLIARDRAVPRVAAARTPDHRAVRPPEHQRPPRYDLRPGRPDFSQFPRREWGGALAAALRDAPAAALDYPPLEGVEPLRRVLTTYRGRVRGLTTSPEHVIVCSGAAQAFMTVADVLRARGTRRIAVEHPGHGDISALLEARGVEPVPVAVDERGLDPALLPQDVGAVLLTPAHQFPLGVVLAPERRRALIAWAQRADGVLIEDDYDAEYRYDRAPVGALQPLDPARVLHIGSVSKTLAPALRLGWLVVPPHLRDDALRARAGLDHGLAALDQLALAHFIEHGAYDRHIRRTARLYRKRRDALLEALAATLPHARLTGAAAGLHTAIGVDAPDEDALVEACRARGLALDGMRRHGGSGHPTLLLSFAALPEPAAPHVARLIAEALNTPGGSARPGRRPTPTARSARAR